MTDLRQAAQQALEALEMLGYPLAAIAALRAALAQEEQKLPRRTISHIGTFYGRKNLALAQQEQEPTVRFKCTVVDDRHPNGVPFEQWGNAPQQEQEPVAYTEDVARRMREAGVTFHLGMPHDIVMKQMTRFHDLVCVEASINAAKHFFATPPRREWRRLTEEEISAVDWKPNETLHDYARAIEAALKEKNNV